VNRAVQMILMDFEGLHEARDLFKAALTIKGTSPALALRSAAGSVAAPDVPLTHRRSHEHPQDQRRCPQSRCSTQTRRHWTTIIEGGETDSFIPATSRPGDSASFTV
jgi:hypothetical protein